MRSWRLDEFCILLVDFCVQCSRSLLLLSSKSSFSRSAKTEVVQVFGEGPLGSVLIAYRRGYRLKKQGINLYISSFVYM